MHPADVVLVVLAAGEGRRLGGVAKALLETSGRSFLAQIATVAQAAGVHRGVVVVGAPHGSAVALEARRLGLEVVTNPQPELGMARSIECGFAWAASERCAGALLWPCDHPMVAPATVTALLEALEGAARGSTAGSTAGSNEGAVAAVPTMDGRGGHPALIARELFAKLGACARLPQGARSVLRASRVRRVPVADAGCVVDVDDPGALRTIAATGRP